MVGTIWNTQHLSSFKTIQLFNSKYLVFAFFQPHQTIELHIWLILFDILSISLL